MGRSTTSCFKIITCGSDSVDRDDLQVSESKSSADKRGWSFRKRSARHRVLSNTVISEVPSSVDKESPEAVSADYQTQPKAGLPEKSSEMQWTDEVPQLSAAINSKFLESVAIADVDTKLAIQPDESVVTVIQTAIRKFLAQRDLSKQKNIVMLQAAVRGHLVRRHAVGSLRCVQAIIKMQVLVRARRTRLSAEEKRHVKPGKDCSKLKGERKSGVKADVEYTSIAKLLNNSFARRLLESSANTKSMNIKCDPSRPDSAWEWMERWVSVSPTGIEQSPKIEPSSELKDQEIMKHPENQVETACAAKGDSESTDFRFFATPAAVPYLDSDSEEAAVPSKSEQNLASQKFDQPQPEFLDFKKLSETPPHLLDKPSDSSPQVELNNLSSKPELEEEQPKRSVERVASEQNETEGRKTVFGSRKASNAAFIAAQSKFEELTSTYNSVNSVNICNQENEVESGEVTVSSIDNSSKTRDTDLADDAIPSASNVLLGGSECGTELSITSTLDSTEQSEFGAVDGHEVNISEEEMSKSKNTTMCIENEARVDDPSIILNTDLSNPVMIQSEKQSDTEVVNEESSKPEEDRLEENSSSMQIKLEHETVDQMYKSSPEASPRSRVTILDSQTTPSSQVSTKSKKIRSEKKGSSQKRKSLSVGKRSPLPSNDSGVRSSLEQLPKDEKSGKRRNSFGSSKTDHVDQEPRDSSSSLSVPSYMQATESARAKAYANLSPRSSPDVQDKESYIKKRHSLPGANGRQGSPRIQRSTSLAQKSTKESGNVPTQEKKWQR